MTKDRAQQQEEARKRRETQREQTRTDWPGAGSGGEARAGDREIPGTASLREGYQSDSGTAGGDALAGVVVEHAEPGAPPPDAAENEERNEDEDEDTRGRESAEPSHDT